MIAISHGAAVGLQNNDGAAFAAHEAVCAGIEALAPPVGRQHRSLRAGHGDLGSQHQVDTAGKGELCLAVPDAAASKVNGNKRRRTRGIERQARSDQIEEIGNAVGGDALHRAKTRICVNDRALDLQARIVEIRNSDVDARSLSRQCRQCESGVLDGLIRHFEQQALLRVGRGCFTRGDAEELRVEAINLADEAAAAAIHPARLRGIRMIHR